MAKAKATQKVETKTLKATALLRKGTLAYIGLYGAAFDRAKFRVSQVRGATDGLFDTLVVKGEEIEGKATVFAKGAQDKVTETFSTTTSKMRGVLPTASNDRVEELEAEVAKLNKKIAAMAKKKATAKKVKIKTEKRTMHTTASLNKMLEIDVVALANDMGIKASIDDLKADTIAKILAKTAAPLAA